MTVIPGKLVEFLHGPRIMILGTRDAKLRPAVARAFGALADAAKDSITFFLPDGNAERSLANLADNGRVALTVTEPVSHETYQFKGAHIESRASTEKDMAVQDIYLEKLIAHLTPIGADAHFEGTVLYPSTAVAFSVQDVFIQTPGPGAGDRYDFTPGA